MQNTLNQLKKLNCVKFRLKFSLCISVNFVDANPIRNCIWSMCEKWRKNPLPFIIRKWKCWCCWWDLCVIGDTIFGNSCSLTPYTASRIDPYTIRIQWQCREFPYRTDCVITYNSIKNRLLLFKGRKILYKKIEQRNKSLSSSSFSILQENYNSHRNSRRTRK